MLILLVNNVGDRLFPEDVRQTSLHSKSRSQVVLVEIIRAPTEVQPGRLRRDVQAGRTTRGRSPVAHRRQIEIKRAHGQTASQRSAPRNLVKRTMPKTLARWHGAEHPVEITSAAVSERVPPTFPVTTMAMSVVTTSAQATRASSTRRRRAWHCPPLERSC